MHGGANLIIPGWANGPGAPHQGTGNGGWTAGLLARFLHSPQGGAVVSLRVPPPIGRELVVWRDPQDGTGEVRLLDPAADDALVATATAHEVVVHVPPAAASLDVAAASAAAAGFPFRDQHPYPHCVCCGIARPPEVPSLGIHCGPVAGSGRGQGHPRLFADTWTPTQDMACEDDQALASVAACWSALDCPSAAPFAEPGSDRASLLARLAVRLDHRPRIGQEYVLVAWERARDGRKQYGCSALLDGDGTVLATADALWIEVAA